MEFHEVELHFGVLGKVKLKITGKEFEWLQEESA